MQKRLALPATDAWHRGLRRGSAHAPQLTSGDTRIRGRMAEDSKDDSVATDDDSDYTGADGNHSLNNVVNVSPLFPFHKCSPRSENVTFLGEQRVNVQS